MLQKKYKKKKENSFLILLARALQFSLRRQQRGVKVYSERKKQMKKKKYQINFIFI